MQVTPLYSNDIKEMGVFFKVINPDHILRKPGLVCSFCSRISESETLFCFLQISVFTERGVVHKS